MPKQHPMPLAGTYSRVVIGESEMRAAVAEERGYSAGEVVHFRANSGGIGRTNPSVLGTERISQVVHQPKFTVNGKRQGSTTPAANLRPMSGKRFFRTETPIYGPRHFGEKAQVKLGYHKSVTDDGGWEREYAPIRKPRAAHEPRSANGRKVPTYQRLGDVKRKIYGGPLRPPVQIQVEPAKAR